MTHLEIRKRNLKVLKYVKKNPHLPFKIAEKKFGITRQRVLQIIQEAKFKKPFAFIKKIRWQTKCRKCGEVFYSDRKESVFCSQVCMRKNPKKPISRNNPSFKKWRAEYSKEYYKKNREKLNAYTKRYYHKHYSKSGIRTKKKSVISSIIQYIKFWK